MILIVSKYHRFVRPMKIPLFYIILTMILLIFVIWRMKWTLRKKATVLLTIIIGWDFSLHVFETINKKDYHPFYPDFPNYPIDYNYFWAFTWGLGLLLALIILCISWKEG
jgi:hypothetical protein